MEFEPVTAARETLRWSAIRARGSAARSFLQGQLTQDVEDLDVGERWSLLLRPDSIVVTSLVVRAADGGFDLVVPGEAAAEATSRLRRFLLRVDCALEVLEDVEGPFATTADLVDARWPGAREFARELAPHSFGSRVLDRTVSFTKGCYTGQELVARLDARGARVPWRLVHATGPSVEAIAAVLASAGPDGPRGVTTAVARDGVVAALGVAHRSLGDAQYGAVGVETL